MRTLVVWCPDWQVVAAELVEGVPAREPVAVLHAGRVVACSPAARAEGVTGGLRKREAQGRCPHLAVVAHDPARDARAFEPVVAAVEQVVAGVEVVRPGACALAARGPARYFGGEEPAAERIVEQVAQERRVAAQAGVADGVFAAGLAARAGVIVPPGGTREFLAGLPVAVLERPELVSRLRRLGMFTLGDFAALPAGDVLARFGFDAALAHRLAAGADGRPSVVRRPPPDLVVAAEYDDPLARVEVAAFAARVLAGRLHERLAGYGLACTRLRVEAVTAHGQELSRGWRHDGLLSPAALADRVRWQLSAWLQAPPGSRPSAGIARLRLVPDGVVAQAAQQPGLWGEIGAGRERAHRALARVQARLGPESVLMATVIGGRSPGDRARLIPWDDAGGPDRGDGAASGGPGGGSRGGPGGGSGGSAGGDFGGDSGVDPPDGGTAAPWPGRLPAPAPATVWPEPLPAAVRDAAGEPVRVGPRLAVSAPPARVAVGGAPPVAVTGWAGPWPADERWWAPAEARREVRFQVRLADGRALLLALRGEQWTAEASYD